MPPKGHLLFHVTFGHVVGHKEDCTKLFFKVFRRANFLKTNLSLIFLDYFYIHLYEFYITMFLDA